MKQIALCLAVVLVGSVASLASACDRCCECCGCQSTCCKVCRCVPDKKKVPKITWDCECEDFCIPGPSKVCGYKCECETDCKCHTHCKKEPIWVPTCAKVHTRVKLVKKEEMKEVCSWKWKVEDLCPKCKVAAQQAMAELPPEAIVIANRRAADPNGGDEAYEDDDASESEASAVAAESTDKTAAKQVSWTSKLKDKLLNVSKK